MTKEEIIQDEQRIRIADAGEEYRKQFDNLPAIRFNAFCAGANWALKSENERLKAEREWISVETPPELDTTVWIFCDGFVTIAYYWMYCDEPAYHSGDERFYPNHWMILVKPQPPKQ